jgi:hypothetical protein
MLQMNPDLLKKNLFMRPVTKRDIVMPFPVVKHRTRSPFDDFFGMNLDDMFFTPVPGETKLAVVSTNPDSGIAPGYAVHPDYVQADVCRVGSYCKGSGNILAVHLNYIPFLDPETSAVSMRRSRRSGRWSSSR